ncbi:hypothetical protein AAGI16_25100, partial [Escherichia coli]
LLCHGTVCVVGKIRDLILQLSKSSIYSTKPRLVTPSALHKNFPEAVRKELMTLGTFMETVKILLHNY